MFRGGEVYSVVHGDIHLECFFVILAFYGGMDHVGNAVAHSAFVHSFCEKKITQMKTLIVRSIVPIRLLLGLNRSCSYVLNEYKRILFAPEEKLPLDCRSVQQTIGTYIQ